MQSRKDTALRALVENPKLTIKCRREALAAMDRPSRLFLTRLANDPNVPSKLCLDAAKLIPQAERRLAQPKAAEPAEPEMATAELDEEIKRLLSGEPPTTDTRGSSIQPESATPKVQAEPSLPTSVQKADVQEADEPEPSPGPVWFREDSAEGDKLSAHLAAKRYRETFGVWDWAVLGQRLAAERERKPKQRLYGMPSCGSELND